MPLEDATKMMERNVGHVSPPNVAPYSSKPRHRKYHCESLKSRINKFNPKSYIIPLRCCFFAHDMGGGEEASTNYRGPALRKGARSYAAYVSVFVGNIIICWSYKLNLWDQVKVALKLRVSVSDIVQRFLACPPLLGDLKNFFHLDSNPLSAALKSVIDICW
jgi:hypothetical protein